MRILYFAKLKQLIGKDEDTIFIEKNKKISHVINELKIRDKNYSYAFQEIKNLQYAVNCEYVDNNFLVSNDDELAIFPPVTGG